MNALVLDAGKHVFTVECDDGFIRKSVIKGKVLKSARGYYNPLCPGDVVSLDDSSLDEDKALITALIPRKNEVVRWNIKKRLPQVLASNLDYLLIVTTPREPVFAARFTDKALAQAEYQNIEPVIICNKYDLEKSEEVLSRLDIWERIGYRVLRVSARTGEGLEDLAALIEGKTCALAGKSGVGKSSLINVLDNSVVLKTGSLSKKYGKGTHTTSRGSLIRLELNEALVGGRRDATAAIIDTPGVKTFQLYGIKAEDLALYYKEFSPFIGKCAFGMSCSHLREEGCAVLAAVKRGEISRERYESFRASREELKRQGRGLRLPAQMRHGRGALPEGAEDEAR